MGTVHVSCDDMVRGFETPGDEAPVNTAEPKR